MRLWLGTFWLLLLLLLATASAVFSPGLRLEATWQADGWRLTSAWPPLQPGDRLLALGPHPLGPTSLLRDNVYLDSRSKLQAWLREQWVVERALAVGEPLKVERQGRLLWLTPRLQPAGPRWHPVLVHGMVGMVFFLVGWVSLRQMQRRPESGPLARRQAECFYLCCLSMATVYLTNCGALLSPWGSSAWVFAVLNLLNLVHFVLAPSLLFHFAWLLARGQSLSRAALVLLYGPGLGCLLSLSVPAMGMLVAGLFLASLMLVLVGSWRAAEPRRQQLRWVLCGFLAGLAPWIVCNGLPLLFQGQRWFTDTVPGAFLVLIPLSMAVAIHRYRLFELGSFFEGSLVYGLTLAGLLLVEALLLTALGRQWLGPIEQPLWWLLPVLLASCYGWFRSRVARGVSRLFRRVEPDTAAWLAELHDRAAGRPGEEVATALRQCLDNWLAPRWIRWEEPRLRARVGAFLEQAPEPEVCLALGTDRDCRLGPLPEGRSYHRSLLEALGRVAEQSALYFKNAALLERVLAERRGRLEEREQMLGDLHDGVGSVLASIQLISHQAEVQELARDALFELQTFLYRDSDQHSLESASWVSELRHYGNRIFEPQNVDFELEVVGELPTRLARFPALSLFRLVREALGNALRHAQARRVWLRLEAGPPFRLRVSDDGQGRQGESKGRGLQGMQVRIESMGGCVRWGAYSDSGGFEVEVVLPEGLPPA